MSEAKKRAGYQDVLDAPEHVVAEVIDGVLYTRPRPAVRHAMAATQLVGILGGHFGGSGSNPDAWVVLAEPELHLGPEPDIVVPDIAAWRRSRFPDALGDAFLSVAPDWLCEVLSPSTARMDRTVKLSLYAREGVKWIWLIDPDPRVLEVFRLDDGTWRLLETHAADAVVDVEPFGLTIELARLWGG